MPLPSDSCAETILALSTILRDEGEQENTFTALRKTVEACAVYRKQQREVLVILVTDEIGDDHAQAEQAITVCKKLAIPVYVLGVTAPLGRKHVDPGLPENPNVVIGPESHELEMVNIESHSVGYDLDVIDSGLGSYWLEWTCRATDGKFLAIANGALDWPSSAARRVDPAVMKKYAPAYVSDTAYAEALSNGAYRSLVEASKLPRARVQTQLVTRFVKGSDAQLARDVTNAQRTVARLEPPLERIYSTLAAGEADRANLTASRHQAGYDLAMGRASAALARVQGYNAMLAQLKQGKTFQDPASTVWILAPYQENDEAGSAISQLIKQSQFYLNRVIDEHPNTPWAISADQELEQWLGWQWIEE